MKTFIVLEKKKNKNWTLMTKIEFDLVYVVGYKEALSSFLFLFFRKFSSKFLYSGDSEALHESLHEK